MSQQAAASLQLLTILLRKDKEIGEILIDV
jgi:hypothetical protein